MKLLDEEGYQLRIYPSVHEALQKAPKQAGYTQDTLSEMLGMTPNHLSAIERGASGI